MQFESRIRICGFPDLIVLGWGDLPSMVTKSDCIQAKGTKGLAGRRLHPCLWFAGGRHSEKICKTKNIYEILRESRLRKEIHHPNVSFKSTQEGFSLSNIFQHKGKSISLQTKLIIKKRN